jgi:hypothetical protein
MPDRNHGIEIVVLAHIMNRKVVLEELMHSDATAAGQGEHILRM